MIEILKSKIKNKNVVILGFGREGQSTYKLIRKHFPKMSLTIADKNENIIEEKKYNYNDKNLKFVLGKKHLKKLNDYDVIFKAPGISLNHLNRPVAKKRITSQSDIFLQAYFEQTIGITGTKGKSTTASLISEMIKYHTSNTVLVGNIGIAPFDSISRIDKKTKIVFELSSHQLEHIRKSPHIGVLLNIFPEHLDHYLSFNDYKDTKFLITKYQEINDHFIYNDDDETTFKALDKYNSKKNSHSFSFMKIPNDGCFADEKSIYFKNGNECQSFFSLNEPRFLKGEHNIKNIMAAITCCKIIGIPDKAIIEGIKSFRGLQHRLEYVGNFRNLHFYNDSIATIPEATIEAVRTIKNIDTIILGGFDRGLDYNYLSEFLAGTSIRNLIFMGKAGGRIKELLNNYNNRNQKYYSVDNFNDAFKIIKRKTRIGKVCLLSPAAASYDIFSDFIERGEVFKKLARSM
ncbi:MAG: UDP-N-acetylmuramoyl-L-alanine--D-glutamate ligase [Bacteroidales bacterium]|nr:UDP-N-acetylmuramoyl-L-alanine--D-glutamate ligase [Bacteroidales bacterium]